MSDEDDDYMSDAILNACAKNDVRPGLVHKHSVQRSHIIEKRRADKNYENQMNNPKRGRLEAERREEGLEKPIGLENKGFAMLQKMGYKPGSSIGKDSSSGRIEPVRVVLKTDRQGLGREAALQEVEVRKMKIRANRLEKLSDYRSQLSSKFSSKATVRDLKLSQITCENLDTKNNIESPPYPWFWREKKEEPKVEEETEEDEAEEKKEEVVEEEEEQLEPEDQLEILTIYLRRTYLYCIWCGTQYEDEDDLAQECPGSTRNDH
ncbi:G patch domain-containing protein 11 [Neocloeon triangulifer]|uniref:G patch domain-containing protein 11 n=1 Tax=Neocloeon triangulifer TaxID=2078957 RepID=UPI00286F1865|nr:G patch domain-containing protein 11 [Neocloeon triangulifer]